MIVTVGQTADGDGIRRQQMREERGVIYPCKPGQLGSFQVPPALGGGAPPRLGSFPFSASSVPSSTSASSSFGKRIRMSPPQTPVDLDALPYALCNTYARHYNYEPRLDCTPHAG